MKKLTMMVHWYRLSEWTHWIQACAETTIHIRFVIPAKAGRWIHG